MIRASEKYVRDRIHACMHATISPSSFGSYVTHPQRHLALLCYDDRSSSRATAYTATAHHLFLSSKRKKRYLLSFCVESRETKDRKIRHFTQGWPRTKDMRLDTAMRGEKRAEDGQEAERDSRRSRS